VPGQYRLERGVLDYHHALTGDFRGAFTRQFGAARDPASDGFVEPRHADVAASAQAAFEDVVLDLARELRRASGSRHLTIAGGCGLNSAATGRILRDGVFEEVYVTPAPHDAGAALGAAMLLYTRLTGRRPEPLRDARLGPTITADEARDAVRATTGVVTTPVSAHDLVERVAQSLATGAVIAWAQGALEFGPRALGSRSFLASPLGERTREVLNEKIKKREPFRPFAPSVKSECAAEFFELSQESPFMSLVVRVRPGKANVIPAVTHVDGTARPQTVTRADHPLFWEVLDRFERLTGVPVLLNTSLNIQEPIVCSASDALTTFLRSGADALVLDRLWIERANHDTTNTLDDVVGTSLPVAAAGS
jgi:carbamoyltransferase